jgi:DNA-binding NarL/FixJ family response regulator
MITLNAPVHVFQPQRAKRGTVHEASGGSPPPNDARTALRLAAMAADAGSNVEVNLLPFWRELASGLCGIVDAFFSDDRCYLVLSPRRAGAAGPVEARRMEMLEALLSGLRPKCIAMDLGLAPSTVALHFKLAMASIGIAGRPSRMHPLLMLIARAASEPAVARCSTLETQAKGELRVLAIPRPDGQLKAQLPTAELEIVQCLVEGLSHQDMALRRGTSTRTIANQISTVFRRLRVSGRNELLQRLLFNHEQANAPEAQALLKAPSAAKREVAAKRRPSRLKQQASCAL